MTKHPTEYVILWEFVVRAGQEADFEMAYSPVGEWATLFAASTDFLGTELLRNAAQPRHYMTVDRWASGDAFRRFREAHGAEYVALDAKCAELTEKEVARETWVAVRGTA